MYMYRSTAINSPAALVGESGQLGGVADDERRVVDLAGSRSVGHALRTEQRRRGLRSPLERGV